MLKRISIRIVLMERSEEEKLRRRLHGDKGAKFKVGKVPRFDPPRCGRHDYDYGCKGHPVDRNL